MLNIQEGVASVADENGKLLFYTDGITVWDQTHQEMNVSSLGGSYTSTQSAVIVPDLSDPLIYYIFTANSGQNASLRYSKVDLSLPGNGTPTAPLGAIVENETNIMLAENVGEKITYILKPSNTGYWVLTHGFGNNRFYAFDIDCNGVNTTPVLSDHGVTYTGSFHEAGYMRSSRDGKKLALVNSSKRGVFLYDFNVFTGKVANEFKIWPRDDDMYGIEFSHNGNYLFIGEPHSLSRFDITNNQLEDVIINKPEEINATHKLKTIQVGPDGNIYVAITNKQFLSVVENPESANPVLQVDKISLGGRFNGWGLPDIFYKYLHPNDSLTLVTCSNSSLEFEGTLYASNSINEIKVPNGLGCDSSILILTIDTFPTEQSYLDVAACQGSFYEFEGFQIAAGTEDDILLTDSKGCDSIVTVRVESVEFVNMDIDTTVCFGTSFRYNNTDFIPGTDTSFTIAVANDCDTLVRLKVNQLQEVNFAVYSESSCWNQTTGLADIIQNNLGPQQYTIDGINFSSSSLFTELAPGNYTYSVIDMNGCKFDRDFTIVEDEEIKVEIPIVSFPCDEQTILIKGDLLSGQDVEWTWPDGSDNKEFIATAPGSYQLILNNNCQEIISPFLINLEERPLPGSIYFPEIFSPNDDGFNDNYTIGLSDILTFIEFQFTIFDRWGSVVFHTQDPNFEWNGVFKQNELLQGVYVWKMEALVSDCHTEKKLSRIGDLTLIR